MPFYFICFDPPVVARLPHLATCHGYHLLAGLAFYLILVYLCQFTLPHFHFTEQGGVVVMTGVVAAAWAKIGQ